MTALRRRMLEDMQVRNLSAGTQQVYREPVSRSAAGRHRFLIRTQEPRHLLVEAPDLLVDHGATSRNSGAWCPSTDAFVYIPLELPLPSSCHSAATL